MIDAISIIASERCNAKCQACGYWREPDGRDFDATTLPTIIAALAARNGRSVTWTGGEPTLHPQLDVMMARVKAAGLKNTLISNGIRLCKDIERYGALLDTLVISLDAPDSNTYRRIRGVDAFDMLCALIGRVRSAFPHIGLVSCLVVQRANIDLLDDFLELADRLGVDRVAFLAPDLYGYDDPVARGRSFGRVSDSWSSVKEAVLPTREQVDALEARLPELHRLADRLVNVDCPTLRFLPMYIRYFRNYLAGNVIDENPVCPMPLHHRVITVNGHLKPCFFVPESFPPSPADPLHSEELSRLCAALVDDPVVRERSCRRCMQTNREYR